MGTFTKIWWHYCSQLYDLTACSWWGVRYQKSCLVSGDINRPISVAIAHYNRGDKIHRPLRNIVCDPRVAEIVIVDDASDTDQYELLCKNVRKLDRNNKIHIYRREVNLGAMRTKYESVQRCTNEWVILLDSDNTIFRSYLDAVFNLPEWRENTIYCPTWAFPYFQFEQLAGEQLDFKRCVELCRSGLLRRIYIINDGNYFLNRDIYLQTIAPAQSIQNDVADVMMVNYLWLSKDKILQVLNSATYFHRIDKSSFWLRTEQVSRKRAMFLFSCFEQERRWDENVALELAVDEI